MNTRIKKILPNFLLAFLATLVALFILEIGIRAKAYLENQVTFDKVFETELSEVELPAHRQASLAHIIRPSKNPRIIYELKPNVSVTYYEDSLFTLNEEGFRSRSYSALNSDEAFRIVGIGDSFMFGQGVSDGEQYLAVIEEQLNQTFPNRQWQIINTAVPGYNTVMEVETLKEKGLKYSPDLVIIEFLGNDLSLPNFIREQEPLLTIRKSFLMEFISESLDYTRQADEIQNPTLFKLRTVGLLPAPRDKEGDIAFESDPAKVPPQYRDMVGWQAYVKAMNELKDLQEQHGFEVVLISQEPTDDDRKHRALRLSAELGFHVVDVGPALRQYLAENKIKSYEGSPLAISKTNGHPSALGHKIAAEELFRYLTQENLIGVGRLSN